MILAGIALAYVDFANFYFPDRFLGNLKYKLGLDLQGGIHLVYSADTSGINSGEAAEAMIGLRDVIERRVNFFGVTEPVVQVVKSGDDNRLIVELAGVFDTNEAIRLIGQTPYLEFKTERPAEERDKLIADIKSGQLLAPIDPIYQETELTGRFLENASLAFDQVTGSPYIVLDFDNDGAKIFAKLTKENIGKTLAIYLDGAAISQPVVQAEITGGTAQITGRFTITEARELVRNLNSGALPIPIKLLSQQSIGASLGSESLVASLRAGLWSLVFVAVFMIVFYRLPGLMAMIALLIYSAITLAIYKFLPVTLTLPGIAGFILSLGIGLDANVLIFARMREELALGKTTISAMLEGFRRSWPSIRDSHVTALIGAIVLYYFTTSIVKGFALTLGLGVILSLFTSTVVTRCFLMTLAESPLRRFRSLFS